MRYIEHLIYWSIIAIPFTMALGMAPLNVFRGLLIFSFLIKKVMKKERVFIKTRINMPLLLFFGITCLSLINSIGYRDTIKGGILRLLQFISILFIVAEEVKDKKHLFRIIISMALGITLVSFDGIWQVFTGRDFIRGYAPVINLGLVRATASFKDSNTFGIYLSAIAPLLLGLPLYAPVKKKIKISLIFIVIMALMVIALTYSRPTLLAIYVILLFLAIIKKHKTLLIILVFLSLASPFLMPKAVKNWAKEVNYNPLRFMCNDDRIAIYRNSLNMIKAHPVIGIGANTFMKNYRAYKEKPEYRNIVTSDYVYAHNNFLHMAAEIGLLGLAIFVWLLYALFKQSKRIYKKLADPFLKTASLSLIACLIAFLINGLTESSLYSSRVAPIFWYLAGLSLALGKKWDGSLREPSHFFRNILVVRNDRFGEFLLNIPALRALKETFPNTKISVIVNPEVKELAECVPYIDEIIEWNQKIGDRHRFDVAIMLHPSKEFNIRTWLAGIPIRVGYNRKWGFLLTHKIEDRKYLEEKHEIEYNLDLVGLIGAKTEKKELSLNVSGTPFCPSGKRAFGDSPLIANTIAIHPWTSDPVKQWPIENFCELAKRISNELNREVVIVGKEEKQNGLFNNLGKKIINLTNKTSLKELALTLKNTKLLITGDSGPMHLACAVGTPVLALFKNNLRGKSAKRWGPWGRGNIVIENDKLAKITVEEVFNKI